MDDTIYNWLIDLPIVNYQCPLRQHKVYTMMTETGLGDIVRCFLAVGNLLEQANEDGVVVQTRDIYICWMLKCGKIYMTDSYNRSTEYVKACQDPPSPYQTRWLGCISPRPIKIEPGNRRVSLADHPAQICQAFPTPYPVGDTDLSRNKHATLKLSLTNTFRQMIDSILDPASRHACEISNVLIKVGTGESVSHPNGGFVTICGRGCSYTVPGKDLMGIVHAFDIRDSTPSDWSGIVAKESPPVVEDIVSRSEGLRITFALSSRPRLARQLALFRIWCERDTASPFQLEVGSADLPIVLETV